jgi:hypothetical protein
LFWLASVLFFDKHLESAFELALADHQYFTSSRDYGLMRITDYYGLGFICGLGFLRIVITFENLASDQSVVRGTAFCG